MKREFIFVYDVLFLFLLFFVREVFFILVYFYLYEFLLLLYYFFLLLFLLLKLIGLMIVRFVFLDEEGFEFDDYDYDDGNEL